MLRTQAVGKGVMDFNEAGRVLRPSKAKSPCCWTRATVKEYGYKELYNIYECRNSLAIEFDLSDFLGQSNEQTTRDDDGDYVMDHVNENQMVLIEDSNFIFGKKGRRVMTTEEIYEADFEEDYIYGIFSNSEILYKDFIFARSGEKTILLRFY